MDRQQNVPAVTVKKESTDKVIHRQQNGDLTKAKAETTVAAAKVQPVAEATKAPVAEKAPEAVVTTASAPEKAEDATPKRKPGRPRKTKTEEKLPYPHLCLLQRRKSLKKLNLN